MMKKNRQQKVKLIFSDDAITRTITGKHPQVLLFFSHPFKQQEIMYCFKKAFYHGHFYVTDVTFL